MKKLLIFGVIFTILCGIAELILILLKSDFAWIPVFSAIIVWGYCKYMESLYEIYNKQ